MDDFDIDNELELQESIEREMQMTRDAEAFDENEYPFEEEEIEMTKNVTVGESDTYRETNNLQSDFSSKSVPKNVPVQVPKSVPPPTVVSMPQTRYSL